MRFEKFAWRERDRTRGEEKEGKVKEVRKMLDRVLTLGFRKTRERLREGRKMRGKKDGLPDSKRNGI